MVPQADPPVREGLSSYYISLYIISISDLVCFHQFSIDFVLPTPPYSFTDPLSWFYRPMVLMSSLDFFRFYSDKAF